MRIPRPVDAQVREGRGFASPRATDVVLAEIDAVPRRFQEGGEDPSKWKAMHLHNDEVKRDRIDLISELEEAGYNEPRLHTLLEQKLADIRDVWPRAQFPVDSYDRLRQEMVKRHPGTNIATEAEAARLLELIELATINDLRIHPGDYDRLAALELQRKDAEMGGLLLLEALHGDNDAELRRKWHDWMFEHLGPKAIGKRHVIRDRSFGHPIRLEGEGLDGSRIDTSVWTGDVILVDFWGMWCIPCREAMPDLKRMLDRHAAKGLHVVGVLSDHQLDKAAAWLAEKQFGWPQIIDRSITRETYDKHRIAMQYAVGAFPTLWLIDRKGILRTEVDREHLEEQVLQMLDEPKPGVR